MVRTILSTAVTAEKNLKYEEAVKKLNTLQTNAQTLEMIRQSRDRHAHLNIPRMVKFSERVGIQLSDMDRLNVIHVSGTKGKGSTCAYCESILRHHGYKTGFFSSPHLVEVRERFCVNGSPLERDKFANYFWEVYNLLDKSKGDHDGAMPNYFGFLTVMALHVFLKEKVDVAIMEVGIGGQYDSTNHIRKPVVCGVSSLGIDHTSILGNTVDKIAWHKAGIFKKGVPAFTVKQPPEAMKVIQERAQELEAPLHVCPDLEQYSSQPTLGIQGAVQNVNATLALQLCRTWLTARKKMEAQVDETAGLTNDHSGPLEINSGEFYCDIPVATPIAITEEYQNGLKNCQWLGRNQTINWPGITFYLDGAHTVESIQQCVDWFKGQAKIEASKYKKVHRVLIFNTTGDRDTASLLKPLLGCQFDSALFCPNIAYETAMSADQTNNTVTREGQLGRCVTNKQTWQTLTSTVADGCSADSVNSCTSSTNASCNGFESNNSVETFPSIEDCINWVERRRSIEQNGSGDILSCNGHSSEIVDSKNTNYTESVIKKPTDFINTEQNEDSGRNMSCNGTAFDEKEQVLGDGGRCVQVLITGSIHLVGGALRVIWEKGGQDEVVV